MILTIIRHIPSLIHGLQFVAQFKIKKTLNHVGYLLTDMNGTIEIISQPLINMFYIDQKTIDDVKPNIGEIVKKKDLFFQIYDFFDRLDEYSSKNGDVGNVK